ncbi:hypothetical protein QFC24_005345 [Naganishia onofrii]|uniref:Uncharacterized protein n=1 Tax=Naganishia onofrii TaxID=1851511 RepID=A0ACC2X9B8_9TREE|nr:hypothetical protein QFC24_005345 [Naganishia onofrii]
MPLHFLGSIAETTSISLNTVFYSTCLLGLLLVFKTVWVEGRKCTWERDWAGKFLIIVAPPSPLVYALLDHLVNLPHPPQVLYLPPIPSPLPQKLLTILHAIRLSAATKTGGAVPVSTVNETDIDTDNTLPDGQQDQEPEQESSIPSASLHCDPLPRSPDAIKEFIRRWAIKPPGTGDDGRRIDAIVWADEWSVDAPLKMFRAGRSKRKGEEGIEGDTWAGVRDEVAKEQEQGREKTTPAPALGAGPERAVWNAEEAKFFFLNSMLPFLLKAPMERSIRLVNVLGPFYSAAVPLIGSSVEEQDKAADQLLVSSSSSAAAAAAAVSEEAQTTLLNQKRKPRKQERKRPSTFTTDSPIVQSGKASLRNILLWKHLQKILDALASASHNQQSSAAAAASSEFKIPPRPGSGPEIPVPIDAKEEAEEGMDDKEGNSLRRRKGGDGPMVESKAASTPTTGNGKKITVQSNILALPVVIGFNRWGIIRPLMGLPDSYLGWGMYLLLAPLIYLFTPSTKSALQSILYALSAPVLYGDDDDDDGDDKTGVPGDTTGKKDEDGDGGGGGGGGGEKKAKSTGKAGKGRRDGVKGGGIIRDASWIPYPFAPSWADPLAFKIWDQLEARVEAGLKKAAGSEYASVSDEGSAYAANGGARS